MSKTNAVEEARKKIADLQAKRAADLEEIATRKAEALEQIEKAKADMIAATEQMDVDAYEEARAAKKKGLVAMDMLSARLTQIEQQELVTEEESDKVIEAILDYENELEREFLTAIRKPLKELMEIRNDYGKEVRSAEYVLTLWQRDIHANFRRPGAVFKETGTDRSPYPIPVHRNPYMGCEQSERLRTFLDSI